MKILIRRLLLPVVIASMIFSVMLLNFTKSALAEKWILFYNSQDEEKYYFDKEGIEKPDKKIVRVWQKKVMVVKDKEEEVERVNIEINCEKRTYKILKNDEKKLENVKVTPIRSVLFDALFENVCYMK